ncbi:MAG: hypothetical protein AAF899_04525 [Pseudomonadota bacterium]
MAAARRPTAFLPAGSVLGALATALGIGPIAPLADAQQPIPLDEAADFGTEIFEVMLPIRLGTRTLGTALARATARTVEAVDANGLAVALEGGIVAETVAALRALGPGFATTAEIEALGLTLSLDPASLELVVEADSALRTADVIDLGGTGRFEGLDRIEPAGIAFGVTAAVVGERDLGGDEDTEVRGVVDGFFNLGGLRGLNFDFSFDVDLERDEVFERGRTLAFIDDPGRAIRYGAGDVFTEGSAQLSSVNLLGLSVERLFDEIQPDRPIRRVGRSSIVLERRARVDVFVNGALVSSFVADAGPLDLEDIPFVDINNRVEIVIEDELGRRTVEDITFGADLDLLEPGIVEFTLNAGLLPEFGGRTFEYTDDPAASAFLRSGLTQRLTASAELQGSSDFLAAGLGAVVDPGFGVLGVEGAATDLDDAGSGFIVQGSYEADFTGLFGLTDEIRLDASYQSEDFALLGDPEPIGGLEIDLFGDYRATISERTSVTAGLGFSTSHESDEDQQLVSLGASHSLGSVLLTAVARQTFGRDEETSVFLGVTWRYGLRETLRGTFSTPGRISTLEARRVARDERGDFGYTARIRHDGEDDSVGVFGEVSYVGNRAEVELGVDQGFIDGEFTDPIAFARAQSGIAFADGRVGIGRDPGRGFYLLRPHPSLSEAEVGLATGVRGEPEAVAGLFGPAVVPVTQPYRAEALRVVVEDAPLGYDLGPGQFVALPGARSGFAFTVGSDAFRSTIGRLTLDGEPLELAFLIVTRVDDPEVPVQQSFTNREGLFSVSGLAPGRYRIGLEGRRFSADFEVAADADALIDLGTLELTRQ